MRYRSSIVFACQSKSCAPPPVGSGGSGPAKALGISKEDYAEAYRKHNKDNSLVTGRYCSSGHVAMNAHLRGQTFEQHEKLFRQATLSSSGVSSTTVRANWDAAVAMIPQMDSTFAAKAHSLSRDTMLHRGASMANIDALKVGAILTDKGFLSTTASRDTAVDFTDYTDDPHKVLYDITVPKGTKVLSGEKYESELILNRGTSLRVTDVRLSNDGFVVVSAEVVP